jgi:hypothetical protein
LIESSIRREPYSPRGAISRVFSPGGREVANTEFRDPETEDV